MDVVVSVGDSEWKAVETFASWSINVDLNGADGEHLATFHDCGYSVVAALTDEEVTALKQRLGARAPVALLSEIHERRRLEKREARRTRVHAWVKRWGARR